MNLYIVKYIQKPKIKYYKGKINAKESPQCIYISVMLIDSVYRKDKNYYLQVFLEKYKYIVRMLGVMTCTCNPATLEAEFRNGVSSIPVGGNSPSIGWWIV